MSHISRHDRHDDVNRTDETLKFKKPYQIVNRPPVTDHDMHEEYIKDPPHNELASTTIRQSWGSPGEEKARKTEAAESLREDMLGSPGRGKPLKETVLEEMATEGSVHPHNPAS